MQTDIQPSLATLQASIDALAGQVDHLVQNQRRLEDLTREAEPILRAMTDVGIQKLAEAERAGWFDFGREAFGVLERVVTTYRPEDVAELGENVVRILDTVRNLTQPDVLAVANDATDVLHHADDVAPVGMFGLVRATRDEEVQRGMAVAVEVLRHLGRTAHDAPVRRAAGQTRPRAASEPTAPAARSSGKADGPTCRPSPPAEGATHDFGGFTLDAQGFLTTPELWTRDFAVAMAVALGVGELGEGHWALIDFARGEYLDKGASPNIRRIGKGSGVDTKEVFRLFPKAPGKTISRIAGIPKPAGCV